MKISTIAVCLTLLCAPLALASPPQQASGGLGNACENARSNQPCEHLGIIPDTEVADGEVRSYSDDEYTGEGTVIVHPGGTVIVDNATITWGPDSAGFIVLSGGTLLVTDSTLEEGADGSEFGIDAQAGSTLKLVGSDIWGGSGIHLATDDAEIHDDRIGYIPVALRNDGVSVEVHHVHFINNDVAVNNTGGFPKLTNNTFEGGTTCVRDWLSDPTITYNTFRGCHTGIYHHRSESKLSFNDMEDQAFPPGTGILVEDTMSPVIEGNTIAEYGTGILIRNARAYIRNNTIRDNVNDGVHVESNSAEMDIQGNLVHGNGRDGIYLQDTLNIGVFENDVYENGRNGITLVNVTATPTYLNSVHDNNATGIRVESAPDLVVDWNFLAFNYNGIEVFDSPRIHVQRNWVNDTTFLAIRLDAATTGADISRNFVHRAGTGIWASGASSDFYYNEVRNASSGIVISGNATTMYGDSIRTGGRGLDFADANGVVADWVEVIGMTGPGVFVRRGGDHILRNVNSSGHGSDGFAFDDTTTGLSALLGVRALDNGGSGLHVFAGNVAYSDQAWWEGNDAAGVRNDGNATIDAENSYWGSPNGPTDPDNPGGDGDAVVGSVDYDPFRETPPGAYSPPALID